MHLYHLYCTNNKWNMGVHRWDNNHAIQNHSHSYLINRHLQQTHNTPHSDTLVYHPTGTDKHTSFSSFTPHLPPSRRDWTSCSLPSAVATSRSLTTEALDAAYHDRNSIQIYIYSVGWDGKSSVYNYVRTSAQWEHSSCQHTRKVNRYTHAFRLGWKCSLSSLDY